MTNANPENLAEAPKISKPEITAKSGEIQDTLAATAAEVTPGLESVEFNEQMEGVLNRVSESGERASETKGASLKRKGGSSVKSTKARTAAQIKQDLLSKVPSEEKMREQIQKEIHREIKWLQRRSLFISIGLIGGSAFEINNIVKRIRDLRGILEMLARATVDALKNLWLRFVHGVL